LKIVDFGVARLASSHMTATGVDRRDGRNYMSPEQARGQEVDARSDIFSAAAVFYFMLTGPQSRSTRRSCRRCSTKSCVKNPPPMAEHEAAAAARAPW